MMRNPTLAALKVFTHFALPLILLAFAYSINVRLVTAQDDDAHPEGGRAAEFFAPAAGTAALLFPDSEKLVFCDNVEIQATQKGVRVELLLQPFGLVCVMADMLTGGTLGRYMEDGLVSWRLNTEEQLAGMGIADELGFSEVPNYFAQMADRFSNINFQETDFGSAFSSTVMGLGIDTPIDVASSELAKRLASLPERPQQFQVLSAIMGLDMLSSPLDIEKVLVQRFRHPENLASTEPEGGNSEAGRQRIKRPEYHPVSFNMMTAHGQYMKPGGDFIFPDRAMTSLVGEGERRRHVAQREQADDGGEEQQQGGLRVRGPLENLMPF